MSDLGNTRTGLDVLADRLAEHIGETEQRIRGIERTVMGVEVRLGDRLDGIVASSREQAKSTALILGEIKTLNEYLVKVLDRVMALEAERNVVPIQQAKRSQRRAGKK